MMMEKQDLFEKSQNFITIPIERGEWKEWCKESEGLGFKGEEFLILVILTYNEAFPTLQCFEEMDNPPEWAKERLLKGLLKEYNCKDNKLGDEFRKRFECNEKAA
jgi:hypothetical protein